MALDDPAIFNCPFIMMTEVGAAYIGPAEAKNLREYLLKGGFTIFDDFKLPGEFGSGGGGWDTFEENMKRVMPYAKFVDLEPSHPIFHSFFEIDSLRDFPQAYNSGPPIFRGLYELVAKGGGAAGSLSIQSGLTTLLGAGAVLLAIATGTVFGEILASPWDRSDRGIRNQARSDPGELRNG